MTRPHLHERCLPCNLLLPRACPRPRVRGWAGGASSSRPSSHRCVVQKAYEDSHDTLLPLEHAGVARDGERGDAQLRGRRQGASGGRAAWSVWGEEQSRRIARWKGSGVGREWQSIRVVIRGERVRDDCSRVGELAAACPGGSATSRARSGQTPSAATHACAGCEHAASKIVSIRTEQNFQARCGLTPVVG